MQSLVREKLKTKGNSEGDCALVVVIFVFVSIFLVHTVSYNSEG